MAISNLRPASAFEVAWRGVSPDDLEAEAAARVAADAALQAQIDAEEAARIAADNTEAEARIAADAAIQADIDANDLLARSELLTEPAVSELASMWSTTLTGEPKNRAGLAESAFAFDGVDGLVLQVTGAGVRAPRAAYRMIPGHKYEVLAAARRSTDPSDPPASSVRLRAEWLSAAKAHVGIAQLDTDPLPVSTGLRLYRKVVSTIAGSEVDVVAAAGTVYFTPLMQTFGTDGTTNILPYIRVTDLTSNTLISADISALDARLTALESQNLNARLTSLEGLSTGSDIARFETRAKAVSAATAGSILAGVDVLEVLGIADGGDDVVKPYSRELADPGSGDRFHDAGGSWWVARAQGLHQVNGMTELRKITPAAGRVVHLNFHTTVGDLGYGEFRGVTGAAAGTYVDNTGTIIVPTGGDGSTAWLRVWDGVTAHVGWFGAKCNPMDLVTDDYPAVKKCLRLFTNGRTADGCLTGVMDVGPGFSTSHPLIYGGSTGKSFKLKGQQARARGGQEVSMIRYIGTESTHLGLITFYGSNESEIEDLNTWPGGINASYTAPAPACWNAIAFIADNTFNSTITAAVTAGTNVVLSVAADVTPVPIGSFLGLGAGGDSFEIVYVIGVDTGANTFTVAKCEYNHAAGVQIGGGPPGNGCNVNHCWCLAPDTPFDTTLSINSTTGGVIERTFTPVSMAGINVGDPVRIGKYSLSETVYVKSKTATTFNGVCNFDHYAGDRVMLATAGVYVGNRLATTVQAAEIALRNCGFKGYTPTKGYAGFRQTRGGNVKNFVFDHPNFSHLEYALACEEGNGPYICIQVATAGITDTIFNMASANLLVMGLEDESFAYLLRGSAGGSNPTTATFIDAGYWGQAPQTGNDEIINYNGALTLINCVLRNGRPGFLSPPIIAIPGVLSSTQVASLTLIGCAFYFVTATSDFVRSSYYPNAYTDVILDGTGRFTMLGCTGTAPGTFSPPVTLPSMIPRHSRWEGVMTSFDPVSLAAGAVGPIQTMTPTATGLPTIPGAALGDIVEASFSLDLQGVVLRAWVSAANTVKFQFHNPTAGTIDLGSGTVRCRVKK